MRAVERIDQVMRAVAAAPSSGVPLSELAIQASLDKATTLRLARSLVNRGWLANGDDGRYRVGLEPWLASRSADTEEIRLATAATRPLRALASTTGDTAYLAVRSGDELVFVLRERGRAPVRANLDVGHRQPIGVGCSGIAMLAALPAAEVAEVLARLGPLLSRQFALSEEPLRRLVKRAQANGFAHTGGMVFFGVHAVGVAVHGARARPIGAISLSANAERLTPSHIRAVLPALQQAARTMEEAVRR